MLRSTYFIHFSGSLSSDRDAWGQFGDFIGGSVNPILSFLSLIALVLTVVLQTQQLENSRLALANSQSELEATREELRRSSEAAIAAANAAAKQAEFTRLTAQLNGIDAALRITNELLALRAACT